MARYLVTGGCGFVGRHLCRRLLGAGDEVVVLDNLSNSDINKVVSGCEFIEGDVRDRADVEVAMAGTDGVFHLAAVASVELCNKNWLQSHLTNQTGSVNVFEVAARTKVKRVVYASSAAVYGENEDTPLDETATTAPLTAYGVDKLGSELHASVASRVHGLTTVGIRPFNIFGPGQDPFSPYSGVISIFMSRLQANEPVTVYGDGMQSRDFIHVEDVVTAFAAAMQCPVRGSVVINAASGHSTTISDLLAVMARILNVSPRVLRAEARVGDIRRSLGSTKRMIEILGVRAKVSLEEGLRGLIENYGDTEVLRQRASS
jgi:UDP-glucose 4-epimerase